MEGVFSETLRIRMSGCWLRQLRADGLGILFGLRAS